jgi:DNA-binding XRE family transcriptional regulator
MNKWTSAAIREFGMSLKLTQEELGVLIGVTTVYVNHLEQGMRKPSIPLCILLNLMKKEIDNSGK